MTDTGRDETSTVEAKTTTTSVSDSAHASVVKTATVPKANRTFSKRMLVVNGALAWCAVFYSIYQGQAEWVAASALALVGALYGAYTGIGHMDFRRAIELVAGHRQADDYAPQGPIQELPE